MIRSQTESVSVDLRDVNWTKLKLHRSWLENQNTIDSSTLLQFIDGLWLDNADLNWWLLHQQKGWLESMPTEKPATELLHFIEVFQDKAIDTEMFTPHEVYGWDYTTNTIGSLTEKITKSNHLKLVVSNYFSPLERIDQPAKPDPILTLLP
jgi:hypothetical protein